MKSTLKAIGRVPRSGAYIISFYYQLPEGGLDVTMPTWEIPARDFDHMQTVVRTFNGSNEP